MEEEKRPVNEKELESVNGGGWADLNKFKPSSSTVKSVVTITTECTCSICNSPIATGTLAYYYGGKYQHRSCAATLS